MNDNKPYSYGYLIIQILFWILSFIILFRIFTKDYNNGTVDWIYTSLFHVSLFFVVTVNIRLVDSLVRRQQYLKYLFFLIILILFGIGIHYAVFNFLSGKIFSDYYFIDLFSISDLLQYFVAYLIISFLLQLTINWFDLQRKQAELVQESQKVQLANLKAQLNPHFLFNSLNNIYSLSDLPESKKGKNYLLKLSDALRYMLYQTDQRAVTLSDELDYLDNYIDLERLRLEDDAKLDFIKEVDDNALVIAPLILLPLIENTFKHCSKLHTDIVIKLKVENRWLSLVCVNNIDEDFTTRNDGGIGLENLKKRLDLLYFGNYSLTSKSSNGTYFSELKLLL